MGFVDRFYYGQARLIVNAPSGSKVTVSEGGRTWEGTGKCDFLLPGTKRYTVTCGGTTKTVALSYGACAALSF